MSQYAQGGAESSVPISQEAASRGLPFEPMSGMIDKAEEAVKAFGRREFTVKHNKITSSWLLSVSEWTPVELQHLLPLVAELTVMEGGAETQQEPASLQK